VKLGQRVDQGKPDTPVELRPAGEFGRDVVADHKAVAPLLDDEHGTDDALILAQQQAARRRREAPVQYRQHAVLAAHVVGAGRDRPQGRPAQHEFPRPKAKQIREVGLAAAELSHGQRSVGAFQMRAQVRFEPARIEMLVRPLVDQFGRFEVRLHRRSASFETRAMPAPQDEEEPGWH